VTTPYRNAIFLLKVPDESGGGGGFAPMLIFPPTDPVFPAEASISPDGKRVAVVLNSRKGDDVTPVGLIIFPAEEGAGNKGQPLVQGAVASPSWAPNSSQIVYLKIEDGERAIRLFNLRTGTDARISEAGKSYRTPKMSPAIEE
jgi:Tol biopolymer transport system component